MKEGSSYIKCKYEKSELWCENKGQKIYGVLYKPESQGKMPLVIFAHELCKSHRSGSGYGKALASQGIAVYTFDFCGGGIYSRSDGETTEMSVMTEAEDLKAVVDAAKNWDFVDPDRIVVIGGSQGGMAAAVMASEYPEDIKGLILLYPGFVIPELVHNEFKHKDQVPDIFSFLGWINVGRNYATDVWDYEPFEEMKKYQKPVLILHGDRDEIVEVSCSQRAAETYPNGYLKVISGAGHKFHEKSLDKALMHITEYLEDIGIDTTGDNEELENII